jgi:hypothetical protein
MSSSNNNNGLTENERRLVNYVSQVDKTSKPNSLANKSVETIVNRKKETFERASESLSDLPISSKAARLLNKYTSWADEE